MGAMQPKKIEHLEKKIAKEFGQTSKKNAHAVDESKRRLVKLADLRPTQITVGMRQVALKQKRVEALEHKQKELMDFILERPIRVVLGPGGKIYVIDHHHLGLALIRAGYDTAPVQVDDDFSKLSEENFWKKMQAKKYVHPCDENGTRQPLSALPESLIAMKDDPYRALAGFVRDAGGFKKVFTPFAEFKWADYFRKLIPLDVVTKDFDKAVKQAVKLAHEPKAKKLPGYTK
jgi:hypothetical protein